ncbi:MAG: leucine-rich repeat domain-containing protein [Lachnospiraceae bacterium]|nr:leucine-rich repeat domain-containing protein [Lachnospiraceae bacterium]
MKSNYEREGRISALIKSRLKGLTALVLALAMIIGLAPVDVKADSVASNYYVFVIGLDGCEYNVSYLTKSNYEYNGDSSYSDIFLKEYVRQNRNLDSEYRFDANEFEDYVSHVHTSEGGLIDKMMKFVSSDGVREAQTDSENTFFYDGGTSFQVYNHHTSGAELIVYVDDEEEYSRSTFPQSNIDVYCLDRGSYELKYVPNKSDRKFKLYFNRVAAKPEINSSGSRALSMGYTGTASLLVTATKDGDGTLSYQWCETNKEGTQTTDIAGATNNDYTVPSNLTEGEHYYLCKVTNTETANGETYTKTVNSDPLNVLIYKYPSELEVEEGKTVGDISLPTVSYGTWSWTNASTNVGNAGNRVYTAVFTPNDQDIPAVTLPIQVKVEAKKTDDSNKTDVSNNTDASNNNVKTNEDETSVAKGTKVIDRTSKAKYEITWVEKGKEEAAYLATTDKKAKTVTVPGTLEYKGTTYKVQFLAANAFKNKKKITNIKLHDNLLAIGDKAFYGCSGLKKLVIPKNVFKIGAYAFKNTKAKTIEFKTKYLKKANLDDRAFSGISKNTVIKVPKGKKKAYTKLFRAKGLSKKVKIKEAK